MEENIINQHRQSKNNFERLKKVLKNPRFYAGVLFKKVSPYIKDDELYLRILWRLTMRTSLNLKNPKTFNEKLQWLKLHDRRPEYTQMVDKYEAKKYVANIIGEEYIIPTLGVWDRAEDIDFDSLPNQFVLKCTHDSGGLVICKDKSKLDQQAASTKMAEYLKRRYFTQNREWPYKDVKPRIIAEKYMEDESGYELKDYKVFNFNGKAKIIQVDFNRFSGHMKNLYSTQWEFINASINYPSHPEHQIPKPQKLKEMLELAEKLSAGLPFLRTDFYSIEDKLYFGELTFFPGSGFMSFAPEELGLELGSYIQLPSRGGVIFKGDGYILWIHPQFSNEKGTGLKDYKIHCFNGQPKMTLVCSERFSKQGLCEDFFDNEWQHLPMKRPTHPNSDKELPRPQNFEIMKQLATQLSKDITFVRIDFYEINGEVYFGELTFFPSSGMVSFVPDNWDYQLGEMIKLPSR